MATPSIAQLYFCEGTSTFSQLKVEESSLNTLTPGQHRYHSKNQSKGLSYTLTHFSGHLLCSQKKPFEEPNLFSFVRRPH